MKWLLQMVLIMILGLFLLIAPRIGGYVADMFQYASIDPDGAFMWIVVHHVVQTLVVLLVLFVIAKIGKINFRLGTGDKEAGMKYLKRFMLFFTIYVVVAFAITIAADAFQPFQYPMTARNVLGYLGFQLFLTGPSEEIIFRAFAMTMFVVIANNKRLHERLSYANLFAIIVFAMAHMAFSFNPFRVSYFLPQVVLAIVLGYFYGDCYEKSRSVVYPMLMHSFSNVISVGLTVILSLFIGV